MSIQTVVIYDLDIDKAKGMFISLVSFHCKCNILNCVRVRVCAHLVYVNILQRIQKLRVGGGHKYEI